LAVSGKLFRPAALVTVLAASTAAHAQHASDDPLAIADDAFGLTLGLESIGLYGPGGIRGFNPQVAGNVRINGLYFDQQGGLSNRVVEGSTIRIGISEIGYPFPAPTGIVDYDLRHTGDGTPTATVVASLGPFEARGLSLDSNVPLIGRELQVPLGASYQISTNTSMATDKGYTSKYSNFGAAPQWSPNDRITVRAIFDWQQSTSARTLPLVFPAGNFVPPLPDGYIGQNWALGASWSENYGALISARLTSHWSLGAGVFRSIADNPEGFSDLYLNTQPNGLADHQVVGYPEQSVASTSGEMRLTGRYVTGTLRHEVIFEARGRDTLATYGGSDVVDVGPAILAQGQQVPEPAFSYGPRTSDRAELWSVGTSYRLQWQGHGDFAAGIQRESYEKVVATPDLPIAHLTDRPLRAYGTAAVTLAQPLTLYGSYTQGLEESGTAPGNAENRGMILPAARTQQSDAGLRFLITPKLKLIAGVFEIEKPYFNLDANNVDRQLGSQRARGLEVSLSGQATEQLNVNVGLLDGKVGIIGSDLRAQGVGPVAFGQPRVTFLLIGDYHFQRWPALSTDVVLFRFGAAPASVDNAFYNPPQTLVNLGSRYHFKILGHPATLRVDYQDVNKENFWNLALNPGFFQFQGPALLGYVTADF
jgi:iron complex outermembrane recepter protein